MKNTKTLAALLLLALAPLAGAESHDDSDVLFGKVKADGGKQGSGQDAPAPDLVANKPFLSILGDTQELTINAGAEHKNRPYLMLGTMSGTAPGLPLGDLLLGINPDAYTLLTLEAANSSALQNTFGNLDQSGQATARITVPAGLGPVQLHHAYVLLGSHNSVVYTSDSVALTVL